MSTSRKKPAAKRPSPAAKENAEGGTVAGTTRKRQPPKVSRAKQPKAKSQTAKKTTSTEGRKKPGPKPFEWSEDIEEEILERIASGEPLTHICKEGSNNGLAFPRLTTIYDHAEKNVLFAKRYARAREDAADTLAAEIIELAEEAKDKDSAAAVRVKLDARKWVAAKLKPKTYGDRQQVDLNANVSYVEMSDDQLNNKLLTMLSNLGMVSESEESGE